MCYSFSKFQVNSLGIETLYEKILFYLFLQKWNHFNYTFLDSLCIMTNLFYNRKNVLGNISFCVILVLQASKKQKLFLMSWCPDTAKVKKKMLYSSSFDALKKSLVGVQKYIQATDLSEASEEAVEEKLRATDRN